MTPVGGSRHYDGRGLGEIGLWGCPSCGEDNTGPLAAGCVHCGAGRPAATMPPPPTPPPPVEAPPLHDDVHAASGDIADYWARKHPDATIAEAYRTGYLDGIRAARAQPTAPLAAAAAVSTLGVPKTWRTVLVALELFRDQVLVGRPEEVQRGEWLAPEEVDAVLAELQALLSASIEEVTHA